MFPFGYPEAWLLEVFGAQNWSFCRPPISFIKFLNPNLQDFWVVHWKSTNKMINFKIFNISLKMIIFFISWQSLVKTVFGVGCPLSTAKYAARNWISNLCGNAAFFQRNSETSSIETFIFEVTWAQYAEVVRMPNPKI